MTITSRVLRKTVLAVSVAAGMAMSSGASLAAATDLGVLGSGTTGAGGMHSGSGSFSDTFTFTLSGLTNIDFSGFSQAVSFSNYSTSLSFAPVSFTNFSLTLPSGLSFKSNTSGNDFSFAADNLAAGTYTLGVKGMTTGAGGFYGLGFQAAPVPEPGEWAMMLAGLGVISMVARRRNRSA